MLGKEKKGKEDEKARRGHHKPETLIKYRQVVPCVFCAGGTGLL